MRILCPKCQREGLRSIVYPQGSSATCLGFTTYYDEEGNCVNNDPNKYSTEYICSNNHNWSSVTQAGKTEIIHHKDVKPLIAKIITHKEICETLGIAEHLKPGDIGYI